jgi:hypothetical protein
MGGQNTWRGKQPAEFKLVQTGAGYLPDFRVGQFGNAESKAGDPGYRDRIRSDCGENGCVLKKETGRNILEDVNIKLLPG